MNVIKVITGGQTGADQAGWRAARAAGLETGGWMTADFWTETGPRPEFVAEYGAQPTERLSGASALPVRTGLNVHDADAVLIFGRIDSLGSKCAIKACDVHHKPWYHVRAGETKPSDVAAWLKARAGGTLMVAGNRESFDPGIGGRVERFLLRVFHKMREGKP